MRKRRIGTAKFFTLLLLLYHTSAKVAIIKQGRLIASGTMDEVKGDQSLEAVFLELEGEKHA